MPGWCQLPKPVSNKTLLCINDAPVWRKPGVAVKTEGHNNLSMINRRYARWMQNADPTAGEKVMKTFADGGSIPATQPYPCFKKS